MHFLVIKFKFPLLLLIVCLIAYLPLSSFLFALKNDAFVYNFPNKYFFSEALREGYLPVWNPYLNFGFPLYADPGFAWWQPLTWIFGFIGYNAYSISIEVLTYIYISGIGMYWLGRKMDLTKTTSFALGSMFMCSGFFIGILQYINYITTAAFIPWFFGFWLLYQKNNNIKNLTGCCISAYLLSTGGHPAIPLASGFFFLLITILYYHTLKEKDLKKFIFSQLKLFFFILLVLSPLLISYWTLLPYFNRSGAVNHTLSSNVGFTLPSYLSFLFPFVTVKNSNFFMTDIAMRNGYFSIAGFIFFILFFIKKYKRQLQKIFFIAGLIMLVFSLGGRIKEYLFDNFLLFSWIRTNGEFRVFGVFSFLICSSYMIDDFIKGDLWIHKKLKSLLKGMIVLFLSGSILFLFKGGLFSFSTIEGSIKEKIKFYIDNISFWDTAFISLLVATILSTAYFNTLKSKQWQFLFVLIIIADLVVNTWLLLPFTGVGKASADTLQQVLNKAPKGFPSPFQLRNQKTALTEEEENLITNWSWYDKKILHTRIDYPSQLTATEAIYLNNDPVLFSEDFIYLLNDSAGSFELVSFKPNSFEIMLNLKKADTLVVLQNYFPGWKAWINKKPQKIYRYKNAFLSIPVQVGDTSISVKFNLF